MKLDFKRIGVSTYILLVTLILSIIWVSIYSGTQYAVSSVTASGVLLIIVQAIIIVAGLFIHNKYMNYLPIIVAVWSICNVLTSLFGGQIDQIGWCIAGLDPMSLMTPFFLSLGFGGVAAIANIVAPWFDLQK